MHTKSTNINLIFSERLKFLRQEQALTQKQLASKLNAYGFDISDDTISSIERCVIEAKTNHIEAFCQFFNVTPDFLFGYTQSSNNKKNEKYNFTFILNSAGIHEKDLLSVKVSIENLLEMIKENSND